MNRVAAICGGGILSLSLLFAPSLLAQRYDPERAYRNSKAGLSKSAERNIERKVQEAMAEAARKAKAEEVGKATATAVMETGHDVISEAQRNSVSLASVKEQSFYGDDYVSQDYSPEERERLDVRSLFDEAVTTFDYNTSSLTDGYDAVLDQLLNQFGIDSLKTMISVLRSRQLDDYEELSTVLPGSERAIELEKDIWACEQDLQRYEDAVRAGDTNRAWVKDMPPFETFHEKGTLFFSREVVEDVLDPMSEEEFLSYCQSANDDIHKRYSGYSDYYMAESCEVVDGKLIARIYFTNIQPIDTAADARDEGIPSMYTEKEKAQYLSELDEKIAAKKLELTKKLWAIDDLEQQDASLSKDMTANNVYVLDNLAQVVKKVIHLDLGSFVPDGAPMGIGELKKQAEDLVNDKIDGWVDAGVQRHYEAKDVPANPYESAKLAGVDNAIQGYNDVNKAYDYFKKFTKAAGIFDKDIPKQFEDSIKALDKSLGHVPSKVKGAVGKYMFFITNRYELGSAIGLVGANIAIYNMKNENRKSLEKQNAEAQQLREDINRLQERRNYIAH